jgi:hypothetical protein
LPPAKSKSTFVSKLWDTLLVKIIWGIGGLLLGSFLPFWPTEPEIEAGLPTSLSSAFDVPFTITNKSKLFWISDLKILCGLVEIKTDVNSGIYNLPVGVNATNYIGSDESSIYVCPLSKAFTFPSGSKITGARIKFIFSYSQSILWSNTPMARRVSKEFSLNTALSPPRWNSERVLR